MLRRILFFAALSTMTLGSQAKVRLPHIISDNMILQQDSKARLWGWDTPGKAVKVNVSWSKETFSAKTDNNGKWILEVQTPKASYTPSL
jgi:sialate O-acetylesterase